MSRRRDRWLPGAALVGLLAMGVLVLVLVTDAVDSGRQALEEAVVSEVQAVARSQSARIEGSLSSTTGFLANRELTFEVGSQADLEAFADIIELLEDVGLRTGFYLTDADGVVTQGVRIQDRDQIGEPIERPGFGDTLAILGSGEVPAAYLPVAPGITTEAPTTAVIAAVSDEDDRLRGTFVLESEVTPDSSFNREISELSRGETGSFTVYDSQGMVVAATNPSLVGARISDDALLTLPEGLHRGDGEVQVIAGIPVAGWRIAFTQDADEFDEGLAGPLQQVGVIVVVVFLFLGVLTFLALARRLRAAREEQDRLRRLNETQEEFISIVSHELRTPVAGVLGFLQTTMDHWDSMTDNERFNALRRSASNARRLQGLTRDVLDSQSVESGRLSYVMSDADLRDEVTVAVEAASALYPRLAIEAIVETDAVPVVIDVDRIQQVLTNLLDNAAKASPPSGRIEVRLWEEGDRAHVSVSDQGPGLAPDLHERVFDKFVRGREASVTGTGLGLYIARQILVAHGGSISVDSGTDGGATFTFELPVARASVPH